MCPPVQRRMLSVPGGAVLVLGALQPGAVGRKTAFEKESDK